MSRRKYRIRDSPANPTILDLDDDPFAASQPPADPTRPLWPINAGQLVAVAADTRRRRLYPATCMYLDLHPELAIPDWQYPLLEAEAQRHIDHWAAEALNQEGPTA